MYVSIAVDPGSEGRARELAGLLGQYGFEKVQRGLWESSAVSPATLTRVKRDLDRLTDAFDSIRFFQYPMEGTLVLSTLKEKKWRRLVARGGDGSGQPPKPAAARRAAGTAPGPAMLRTSVGTAVLGTRKTKTAAALKTRRKK